jgi:mono/diheme cytochrome c family protein
MRYLAQVRLGAVCIAREAPLIIRIVLAALCLSLVAPALAEDDPIAVGRVLIETYCSGCHSIETIGDSPYEGAPPFRSLHDRYDLDWLEEGLVEGLVSGHPDMPEFEFDPLQAEAIVSYLKALTLVAGK